MIIFTAAGQLGNQIFQIYYLETIKKKNEKIFSLGLGAVLKELTGYSNTYYNNDNRTFKRFFDVVFRRLLIVLSKLKLISEMHEENNIPKHSKGLLPITFCRGYFQSEQFFNKELLSVITLRDTYIAQATQYMQEVNTTNKKNIFMHVRHGDYPEKWLVDDVYYKNAIKHFNTNEYFFFLVGDDPKWMKDNFSDLPYKIISKNPPLVDLAIMMQCDGGIVSNSSFAWWGAYLRKGKDTIIAPKYWLGYKEKNWNPSKIQTESFTYME